MNERLMPCGCPTEVYLNEGHQTGCEMFECVCETPSWVAGVMAVHPEDLAMVVESRHARGEHVECANCGGVHPAIEPPERRYSDHNNDLGDWCGWSLCSTSAAPESRCPAGCRGSFVEPVDSRPRYTK